MYVAHQVCQRRLAVHLYAAALLFEVRARNRNLPFQALADLVRHIHLAPLKAGLTADASSYLWSSHRVYLGLAQAPWLATDPLLKYFRQAEGDAVRGYMKFMGQGAENVEAIASLVEPARVLGTPRSSPRPDKK